MMSKHKPLPETRKKQPARIKTTAEPGFFSPVSGSLKGTVTISPGVDFTLPVGREWDITEQTAPPTDMI